MNNGELYNIIYALAAKDGRERVLFGASAGVSREAFQRGLVEGPLPELWFELPLIGEPQFDLHMLVSRADVGPKASFAGLGGPYAQALTWFAGSKDTRQLALSFDTGVGDAMAPAIQLLLDRPNLSVAQGFLRVAGNPELATAYEKFVRVMPKGWYACYSGLFPARECLSEKPWLRVECLVGGKAQRDYADDAGVLRAHLAQIGMDDVHKDLLLGVQRLARSPFPLELQFNVGTDGRAMPVLGASVRFQSQEWTCSDGSKDARELFQWAQDQGLADDRWKQLANTAFSVRAQRGGEKMLLTCYPAFIKLRWRRGLPPDAKAYLIATVT